MNAKLFQLGIIAALHFFLALLFHTQMWIGASLLLMSSLSGSSLLFLFVYVRQRIKTAGSGREKFAAIYTGICWAFFLWSVLFKMLSWPLSGTLTLITLLLFLVYIPVFLSVLKKVAETNLRFYINQTIALMIAAIFFVWSGINVSKSLLDNFVIVDQKLQSINKNLFAENSSLYLQFEIEKLCNPVACIAMYEESNKIKDISTDMLIYIRNLKKFLIAKTDGYPLTSPKIPFVNGTILSEALTESHENILNSEILYLLDSAASHIHAVSSKDNFTIPTHIMCSNPSVPSNGLANQLKNQLVIYRESLLKIIYKENPIINPADLGINTSDAHVTNGSEDSRIYKNWESYNFHNQNIVSDLVTLSTLEHNVLLAENQCLRILMIKLKQDTSIKDSSDNIIMEKI